MRSKHISIITLLVISIMALFWFAPATPASTPTPSPTPTASVTPIPTPSIFFAVLDVLEKFQAMDQWCWAGVSEAILNYYEDFATQSDIADYGTGGVNTWNYLYGFDASRKGINMIMDNWGVSNTYGAYAMSLGEVEARIDNRQPFVTRWGWDTGGGHFLAGRGYAGSYLYYMDPWPGNGYQIATYAWVLEGDSHTWTHSLECTSQAPTSPTPTPTLTPTPSPTVTATPSVPPSPIPTASPTPSISPTPTISPIPSATPQPTVTPAPTGTPPITIIIYAENLSSDPGWTTESDWAFGVPAGEGGPSPTPEGGPSQNTGYPDPTSGHSGDNVYGYNLQGNYPNSMHETYYLTTESIDCSGFENVTLYFWRWLNVERSVNDYAYIQASSDGSEWHEIWKNSDIIGHQVTDSSWIRHTYVLSSIADTHGNVRIRWGMGPTDTILVFSGWNIDDIEVWGVPIVIPTPTPRVITPTPTTRVITPTPTISPIPTLTPAPTATPTLTPTTTATPMPSPTPSPSVTVTPISTTTPIPSPTPGVPVLIYSFPLNSDPGWMTQADWAFGVPLGLGGDGWSYPDPSSGHTDSNVYGYNLSGNYPTDMPAYYLTTKAINCTYLLKTRLKFWRWLNVERRSHDEATIQISNDGSLWNTIWTNSDSLWTTDSSWSQYEYDISSFADDEATVYIRWIMGPTDYAEPASGWNIDDIEIWGVPPGRTPVPTPTPEFSPTPESSPTPCRPSRSDFNGDGTADIAIFRPSSGLWAIRGVTRIYFGGLSDLPEPGDYDGDGTADPGIFRSNSGLWAIRSITRVYFGGSSDQPMPSNFTGTCSLDIAIFRPASGLWAIREFTRIYFGGSSDSPLVLDMDGDGRDDPAIFRSTSGLWAVRGVSRFYFGGSDDIAIPARYRIPANDNPAIFRPASGLWAIRGITRTYFGASSDQPVPGDYSGDTVDDIGIFRETSGLWAIKGVTRVYFGGSGDIPK